MSMEKMLTNFLTMQSIDTLLSEPDTLAVLEFKQATATGSIRLY